MENGETYFLLSVANETKRPKARRVKYYKSNLAIDTLFFLRLVLHFSLSRSRSFEKLITHKIYRFTRELYVKAIEQAKAILSKVAV
jgi:hypothetical protein